jgi:bile acid:Na+ symporter, BASS family
VWTAHTLWGALTVLLILVIAVLFQRSRNWKPFAFSSLVLAFVAAALFFPVLFRQWGNQPASLWIPTLIQIIMFGMGTTLHWRDFSRILLRPKAVILGMVLQFSVMPLLGWSLAYSFRFPAEIAAGVILIGSCPGGVASNVIAYLSRGDVALSVTMTACSTLAAPLLTPLLMSLLAGATIAVNAGQMTQEILKIVIVPVVLGLICNQLLHALHLTGEWLDRLLSLVAMLAICVVIGIIVAISRDDLLTIGPLIFLCAVLHNGLGYLFGYWGARCLRLTESECRTISIEVGMQNGGMGTALATKVLASSQAALAPAIFGPWMSIAGSILASYWRRRPITSDAATHDAACQPPLPEC